MLEATRTHSDGIATTLFHAIIYGFGHRIGSSAAGALAHILGLATVLGLLLAAIWIARRFPKSRL